MHMTLSELFVYLELFSFTHIAYRVVMRRQVTDSSGTIEEEGSVT
jgi:hypothetical protein